MVYSISKAVKATRSLLSAALVRYGPQEHIWGEPPVRRYDNRHLLLQRYSRFCHPFQEGLLSNSKLPKNLNKQSVCCAVEFLKIFGATWQKRQIEARSGNPRNGSDAPRIYSTVPVNAEVSGTWGYTSDIVRRSLPALRGAAALPYFRYTQRKFEIEFCAWHLYSFVLF
ncbi:hypothetical protein CDAR_107111 [Caerostris darwini]|uniref:Uncharacterized protein n=1 Tax=Caerostris darwini TaxID=1538125 RepID=A0AAV4SV25_9ARAC|nr:hypothetical protein CDAR_107111 [Caerostris darwini]